MIKIIITIIVTLISNVFFAQSSLDKFAGQEGVASVIVNKKMFQMMSSVKVAANDKETQEYLHLMKKLDNLKVFTTSNTKIAADMKLSADEYRVVAGLQEMTTVADNGKNVKIWAKSGVTEGQIKELLMYSENANKTNETVLMSLTGDFTLSDIAILADKMKISGGGVLNKK